MLLEEYISRKQALFMVPKAPEELKNEAPGTMDSGDMTQG